SEIRILKLKFPMPSTHNDHESPLEIAISGDLSEHEHDIYEKLLAVSPGGECTLYFNSPGGSAYAALSLASLIVLRGMNATGPVLFKVQHVEVAVQEGNMVG